MGEMRNAYAIWVGKPEWKRQLGRHGRRWEDLAEVVGRVHQIQDTDQWRALVNTVMNLRVP
jgi:hypothetical protein